MKKILITVTSVTMLLAILSPATIVLAASPVIVNGSFETGNYDGWTLWEGNNPYGQDWPECGTWGIAYDGEVIESGYVTYDFCDGAMVEQRSLPDFSITYETTDGEYLAYQLQTAPQDHRMYQDVKLPDSTANLSWDMFYTNHAGVSSDSQYLAVHIRDPLSDSVLETLFTTEGDASQSILMTHFTCDISDYAGSEVRIDVEMRVNQGYLDAGFDNFVIEQDEYTITATAGDGGTISPSGDVTVNNGDSQTFTITADAGYYIDDVLVDGASAGAVDSYTFTSVETNHTIEAAFAIDTYTITATAGAGGSISPSGDVTVNNGDSQTFTITPDAGYHIADVLVDSVSVGVVSSSPGSYTFTGVDDNHTIDATFAKEPPGWSKESKEGWDGQVPPGLDKNDKTPPGFDKGNKTGWDNSNIYGLHGLGPPGLYKNDKTTPGSDKGNKTGWK
jgi:hypothetical protein